MSSLAIVIEIKGIVDQVCDKITEAIKPIGFGILTRIDLDQKFKEKLNETTQRCVILGACNPKLAFEAYQQSTDTALLVPCNIVVTDIGDGKVRVEAMRPSMRLNVLQDVAKSDSLMKAERDLETVIQGL